jgi:8-amino-7-oxononanoate synthase
MSVDLATRRLEALSLAGLRRRPPLVETEDGVHARVAGQPAILFCSNDYLGLRMDVRLRRTAAEAALRWGAGSGASRLITGTLPIHLALEAEVAAWMGTEGALVLGSGWAANVGLLAGIAQATDLLVSDALNHASLVDGCRLARAAVRVVPHADVGAVSYALTQDLPGHRFVVGEGIYSMDGDRPDLGAWLDATASASAAGRPADVLLDEAHAVGILGPGGAGLAAELGRGGEVLARVGTFGKALGAHGAFIATDLATRELLLHVARPFVFSTALPPAAAGAALEAVRIVRASTGDALRERLLTNVGRAREALCAAGFPVEGDDAGGPILPIPLGDPNRAVRWSRALLDRGAFVQAIRPPTVPPGTSRLRITLSASHTDTHLELLVSALCRVREEEGRA